MVQTAIQQASGNLRKMKTRLSNPVDYKMPIGGGLLPMNPLLGEMLHMRFSGNIHCVNCGRSTKKSFNQGYCFPCFQRLAQCDSCIIHPEKCHFDQGTCREPEWGEEFCMQDHIVYLANSSGLKVGITRATQIPTRWVDQGAVQALAIIRVRTRLQSGTLEAIFRQHVADKTNWRDMLKPEDVTLDLCAERDSLLSRCATELEELRDRFGFFAVSVLTGIDPITLTYPIIGHPDRIQALSFDKQPEINGRLLGIRGQYLLLDSGVINIRRFAGYEIEVSINS